MVSAIDVFKTIWVIWKNAHRCPECWLLFFFISAAPLLQLVLMVVLCLVKLGEISSPIQYNRSISSISLKIQARGPIQQFLLPPLNCLFHLYLCLSLTLSISFVKSLRYQRLNWSRNVHNPLVNPFFCRFIFLQLSSNFLKHSSSFKYCHSNKSLISACDRSSASLFFSGYLYYYFKSIFATIFFMATISLSKKKKNKMIFFLSFYFLPLSFEWGTWSLFDWL